MTPSRLFYLDEVDHSLPSSTSTNVRELLTAGQWLMVERGLTGNALHSTDCSTAAAGPQQLQPSSRAKSLLTHPHHHTLFYHYHLLVLSLYIWILCQQRKHLLNPLSTSALKWMKIFWKISSSLFRSHDLTRRERDISSAHISLI